jgi:hypothetical protein
VEEASSAEKEEVPPTASGEADTKKLEVWMCFKSPSLPFYLNLLSVWLEKYHRCISSTSW